MGCARNPRVTACFLGEDALEKWSATAQETTVNSGSIDRGRQYLDMKFLEEFRLGTETFNWLMTLCHGDLSFQETNMRKSVPAEKRWQ